MQSCRNFSSPQFELYKVCLLLKDLQMSNAETLVSDPSHSDGVPVPAELADSTNNFMQSLKALLVFTCYRERAGSAFCHVYITPKTVDGKLDPHWKIICLADLTPAQIETQASTITGGCSWPCPGQGQKVWVTN